MSRLVIKPTKWLCAQRRLRSAWASAQSDQFSLSAWRKLGSSGTHLAHSEDSDQTGQMPRLIWIFARRTLTLLVLSRGGSDVLPHCFCHSMQYPKFPKYSDTKKFVVITKIWTMWLYNRVMSPNDADGMANSVNPDQTAPLSGSALFAQASLSENLGSLRYI